MQLTSSGLQDEADALGGAWQLFPNMREGFRTIVAVARKSGWSEALERYNGSSAYAVRVLKSERRWARALGLRSIQR